MDRFHRKLRRISGEGREESEPPFSNPCKVDISSKGLKDAALAPPCYQSLRSGETRDDKWKEFAIV